LIWFGLIRWFLVVVVVAFLLKFRARVEPTLSDFFVMSSNVAGVFFHKMPPCASVFPSFHMIARSKARQSRARPALRARLRARFLALFFAFIDCHLLCS
jgi:hypothetical protein